MSRRVPPRRVPPRPPPPCRLPAPPWLDARHASQLLDEAATAARDLDAGRMADIVRRMQDARDALTAQSSACTGAPVSGGSVHPSS